MLDIYNFVVNNIYPGLPSELYYLIPITCVIILVFILLACISPFIFLFSLMKR